MLLLNKCHKIDVLEGLKQLPDSSADVEIIDPPYNIGKDFGNNFDNLDLEEYIKWCRQWIAECERVLKDNGTGYIYGFSEILAYLLPELKLPKRWLVWHYTNKNAATNKFWQRSHESIICFWKQNRIFNLDNVREPYTETFIKNAAGKKRAGTSGRFSKKGKETIYVAHKDGALPRDVIKIPALAGGAGRKERFFYCKKCNDLYSATFQKEHKNHDVIFHPTQKPFDLSIKLLTASKPKEGGYLVVPFVGTGGEMRAAKTLGMDVIGFDINKDYVTMSNMLFEQGFPSSSKPKKPKKPKKQYLDDEEKALWEEFYSTC